MRHKDHKVTITALALLISLCTVYFNSKVQLPYGQFATGCRIHYIQIRLDNLQDFAPTTEQITTGSRHSLVATKSVFGHPTWFNPQFTGIPSFPFLWNYIVKGFLTLLKGNENHGIGLWYSLVHLVMAWKSPSLEYQHSASTRVVRSFQLEVDSPSLKLDSITQVGFEQTNQTTSLIDHIV